MKRDEAISLPQAAREIAELARENRVAVIFGSEKYGMAREDVDRCNRIITLPVDPQFPSVNLAQAVAMVCVEIKIRMADAEPRLESPAGPEKINLPLEKRQRFYEEMFRLFTELDMGEPSVRLKLQNVFERANPDEREMNLFYGLIKEIRRRGEGR
jgi:tRNA C32,U32 (ribose-2'-O)-methylase TrmJ